MMQELRQELRQRDFRCAEYFGGSSDFWGLRVSNEDAPRLFVDIYDNATIWLRRKRLKLAKILESSNASISVRNSSNSGLVVRHLETAFGPQG